MDGGRQHGVRAWSFRVASGLSDQGAVSLATFLTHVLLARAVSPAQYGSFAIAFSVFVLLINAHTALLSEPAAVLGPARYDHRLGPYVRAVLSLQLRGGGAIVLGSLAAGAVAWSFDPTLGACLGILAVTGPTFLWFLLGRQLCYVLNVPRRALVASLVYLGSVVASLGWLYGLERLTPWTALLTLGLGAVAGVAIQSPRLNASETENAPAEPPASRRQVARQHWQYGKWILGSGVAFWCATGLYAPVLGFARRLAEAGSFRALENLVAPLPLVFRALGLWFLPWLSRRRRSGVGSLAGDLLRLWSLTLSLALAYGVVLWGIGPDLMDLVYGPGRYRLPRSLWPWLAALPLMWALDHGLALCLRGAERTRAVFVAALAGALASVSVGFPLAIHHGVAGAVQGLLLGATVETLVLAVAFPWRERRGEAS